MYGAIEGVTLGTGDAVKARRDLPMTSRQLDSTIEMKIGSSASQISHSSSEDSTNDMACLIDIQLQDEEDYDPKPDKRVLDRSPPLPLRWCTPCCGLGFFKMSTRRAKQLAVVLLLASIVLWCSGMRSQRQQRELRKKLVAFLQETTFTVVKDGALSPKWQPSRRQALTAISSWKETTSNPRGTLSSSKSRSMDCSEDGMEEWWCVDAQTRASRGTVFPLSRQGGGGNGESEQVDSMPGSTLMSPSSGLPGPVSSLQSNGAHRSPIRNHQEIGVVKRHKNEERTKNHNVESDPKLNSLQRGGQDGRGFVMNAMPSEVHEAEEGATNAVSESGDLGDLGDWRDDTGVGEQTCPLVYTVDTDLAREHGLYLLEEELELLGTITARVFDCLCEVQENGQTQSGQTWSGSIRGEVQEDGGENRHTRRLGGQGFQPKPEAGVVLRQLFRVCQGSERMLDELLKGANIIVTGDSGKGEHLTKYMSSLVVASLMSLRFRGGDLHRVMPLSPFNGRRLGSLMWCV
ncbi:unnamed protein product [Choristocarpus tenellus]